ncbi:MAG: hypothetical protein ACFFED_17150 [Candidatus Thorarchaeota archaeon]
METIPLKKNTAALAILAVIAALGLLMRYLIRITIIPELVEITPGFLFSELGGVIGGIFGGILVGLAVGIGGALGGGEFSLIPLIGNIFLGIGTGYAIHITKERDSMKYAVMAILGGGLIGGFIPDMTIFLFLSETLEAAFLLAVIDMIQGFIWAAVAIILERMIIRPIAGHYLYPDAGIQLLDKTETS